MSIKLNRARSLSSIGSTPRTFDAFVGSIPGTVVNRLSAAQIAAIIDAMHQVGQTSKHLADQEAVENGGVWDHRRNAFRPLAA